MLNRLTLLVPSKPSLKGLEFPSSSRIGLWRYAPSLGCVTLVSLCHASANRGVKTLKAFIVSAVFFGILVILLLYSNIVLNVYHPMASARPLDTAFIHAPIRLFLNLPLTVLLPVSIL